MRWEGALVVTAIFHLFSKNEVKKDNHVNGCGGSGRILLPESRIARTCDVPYCLVIWRMPGGFAFNMNSSPVKGLMITTNQLFGDHCSSLTARTEDEAIHEGVRRTSR